MKFHKKDNEGMENVKVFIEFLFHILFKPRSGALELLWDGSSQLQKGLFCVEDLIMRSSWKLYRPYFWYKSGVLNK